MAKTWDEAVKLAAEGWDPFSVTNANGDEWLRIYLKREVKK